MCLERNRPTSSDANVTERREECVAEIANENLHAEKGGFGAALRLNPWHAPINTGIEDGWVLMLNTGGKEKRREPKLER